jgi:hypothetical protein
MSFSESLTVRILGDSSQLQDELRSVSDQFDQLQRRMSEVSQGAQRIGQAFRQLSSATRPLQQLHQLLGQIHQQLRAISQQPVTLNVQPALQALQSLLKMAQAVAAQLQALGGIGVPMGAPGGFPGMMGGGHVPAPAGGGPRGMISGGLVAGPPGIDRVPVRLTAGEFVLRREVVQRLGGTLLDRLNRTPDRPLSPRHIPPVAETGRRSTLRLLQMPMSGFGRRTSHRAAARLALAQPATGIPNRLAGRTVNGPGEGMPNGSFQTTTTGTDRSPFLPIEINLRERQPLRTAESRPARPSRPEMTTPPAASPSTTNHFGGITIQVREAAEVDSLLRDLRHQGIRLRNRRG